VAAGAASHDERAFVHERPPGINGAGAPQRFALSQF